MLSIRWFAALSLALTMAATASFGFETGADASAPVSASSLQDDDDDDGAGDDAGDDDDDDDDQGSGTTSRPSAAGVSQAQIHAESCGTPNASPLFSLSDLAPRGDDAAADGVAASETEIAVSLDDLVAQPHVIDIRAPGDERTIVACGEVVGPVIDEKLVVGLRSQSGSGLAALAILADDDDDNESEIEIYLFPYGDDSAAPATTTGGTGDDDADDAGTLPATTTDGAGGDDADDASTAPVTTTGGAGDDDDDDDDDGDD
ncbi:MAG: hypothetical protein M3411_03595 [Chloroflexota bacterium]|nr:hypothetical protein [Chloroflexota bacterium]